MSFLKNDKDDLLGAGVGAGLAYAFYGQDLLSLGVGAAAGWFVYPMLQKQLAFSTMPYGNLYLPAGSGAAIAYGLYGSDLASVGVGAAAGAGAGYLVSKY